MLFYLASPYSRYPHGLEAAFNVALDASALLIRHGVPVFSPIAHTHPIAIRSGIDPHDHKIWLPAERPIMDCASGLIMLRAESWEISYGMNVEREAFAVAGKPIVWMDPGVLPEAFR